MGVNETIWFVTLVLTLAAGWIDWRTRRIPNWLTVSGFLLGVVLNSILGGWPATKLSLEGAALGLVLLLPLVLMRGFGAGDWKLVGAVGALMGWKPMLTVLLFGLIISGIAAAVQVIITKRVKTTIGNVFTLVKGLPVFGLLPNPQVSLDNPTLAKLPFGTSVAAATAFWFVMVHWRP
jgi:prepilin peptidase CpaA